MASKKARREKFLADHKYCCFCGGETLAEEEDHFPSRAMFDNRQWPEGYVFPACVVCNRISRKEEVITAFLSRLYIAERTPEHHSVFKKHANSIEYNYPGLIGEMIPTIRERRNYAKEYDIPIFPGQAKGELPVISIDNPIINDAVLLYSRKLLLALYYKHTGEVFPKSGIISINWYTNLQIANDESPKEISSILPGSPEINRCNTSLGNQFFYNYGVSECRRAAGFSIQFRESFSVIGIMFTSKEGIAINGEELGTF